MITLDEIRSLLGLRPHPAEGGFFAETYRAREWLELERLTVHAPPGPPSGTGDGSGGRSYAGPPGRGEGSRSLGTAIYYLMTPEAFSAMHRLATDEIFHFYLGDPVEMLQLDPDGTGKCPRRA